jgi:hypothetical protein
MLRFGCLFSHLRRDGERTRTLRDPQLAVAVGTEPEVTTGQRTKERSHIVASRAPNLLVLAIPAAKRLHFFPDKNVFFEFSMEISRMVTNEVLNYKHIW